MRAQRTLSVLPLALALCLFLAAAPAQASRPLLSKAALQTSEKSEPPSPPPEGQIEGACGLAVSAGTLYVSDYYHGLIYSYQGSGASFAYSSSTSVGASPEGPCQLAVGPGGQLYANVWHQSALRIEPSTQTFDIASSTGIATDAAGNLYVNDRTHVNIYSPAGALLQEVGTGSLGDAYGLAVSGKEIYVADAANDEVKVFEPEASLVSPIRTISGASTPQHRFVSLLDASLAIDPTNDNLLVLDNLQPGFEHPLGAIEEFDSSGAFLGQLKDQVIDALPSGLAVDPETGNLFATSGNSEGSNVFAWGPYSEGGAGSLGEGAGSLSGASEGAGRTSSESGSRTTRSTFPGSPASTSAVIQHGNLRVALKADLAPHKLPRGKDAPIRFSFSTRIASTDGSVPARMQAITLRINRYGHLDPAALPTCRMEDVQPSTTQGALAACRSSFVGEGHFAAKVLLTKQSPFPSSGRIVAFNGTWKGRPAILAHIYGTSPVPTSFTIPFVVSKLRKGIYGTQLHVSLPRFSSKWGYVTGISLNLGDTPSSRGRAYLSASCPAPAGFSKASFSLAQEKLTFEGHGPVTQTLMEVCGVRG